MPYQTNGVGYQAPGYNPYYNPYAYPANSMTPTYVPNVVPNQTLHMQPQQGYSVPTSQFVATPIHGHTIRDDSVDIPPNDVPMDGTVSLFPTEDYSCIFAKQWNKDGKITTTKFVPVPEDEEYAPTPGFEDEMRSRMDELKSLIQQNRSSYKKQYRNNNNQKQGENNGTV